MSKDIINRDIKQVLLHLLGEEYSIAMLEGKFTDGKICPDKTACINAFVQSFANEEMKWDLPLIIRDFLKHEMVNISNYKDLGYVEDLPEYSNIVESVNRMIIHAMYQASIGGSEYSAELLKYLFKIYYPKLYNPFKKFKELSAEDIINLAETSEVLDSPGYMISNIAILLCMAELFGIDLLPECDLFYSIIDRFHVIPKGMGPVEYLEFPEGLFVECRKEIDSMFGENYELLLKKKDKSDSFVKNTLQYNGFPALFVWNNGSGVPDLLDELARTLCLYKMSFPGREYTKTDLLTYLSVYEAIDSLTNVAQNIYDNITDYFGLGDDGFYEDYPPKFNAEKINKPANNVKVEPQAVKKKEVVNNREYNQDDLINEIEKLRAELRQKDLEIKDYKAKLHGANKIKDEYECVVNELEKNKQEITTLKSHLYNMTEYDTPATEQQLDEMKKELMARKITIVGGHLNWVSKMKKEFPSWNFISPNVSVSNDSKWVSNSEFVYFFTDTLSHSVYNTYVDIVRNKNIPFGYIHGVNIAANIKQIWLEVVDK